MKCKTDFLSETPPEIRTMLRTISTPRWGFLHFIYIRFATCETPHRGAESLYPFPTDGFTFVRPDFCHPTMCIGGGDSPIHKGLDLYRAARTRDSKLPSDFESLALTNAPQAPDDGDISSKFICYNKQSLYSHVGLSIHNFFAHA